MNRAFLTIWKCSDDAKYADFGSKTRKTIFYGIKIMPLLVYAPRHKKAVFGIVQRRNSLKLRYLGVAYSYALRGASHGITSRDFVCQSPNQKPQIFLRLCSLGAYRPQSPGKER